MELIPLAITIMAIAISLGFKRGFVRDVFNFVAIVSLLFYIILNFIG